MASRSATTVFYIIVLAQFCGTSLWFAVNAILPQLIAEYHWHPSSLAYLTSSTQLGFILGTLVFAIQSWNDRFSPSKIFFICSVLGSVFNLMTLIDLSSLSFMLISRFLVGFSLAGIYPVGMKIAADWNKQGLGHWLGALVGALVLGTAFPQSLKLVPALPDASSILVVISVLALLGGVVVFAFVPDGPFRKYGSGFTFKAFTSIFLKPSFRAPAFGYFGHMWELYAMWAFIPLIFSEYIRLHDLGLNPALFSFVSIGAGAVGCYVGGLMSFSVGSERVSFMALLCSGVCCLVSPLMWALSPTIFSAFLFFWGVMMAADSPQFSALVARHAPDEVRGSAITIVICIGFAITIVSIQLLAFLRDYIPFKYLFLILAPGPIFGLLAMRRNLSRTPKL